MGIKTIKNGFSAFKKNFLQLILAFIALSIITLIPLIIGLIPLTPNIEEPITEDTLQQLISQADTVQLAITSILALVSVTILMILSAGFIQMCSDSHKIKVNLSMLFGNIKGKAGRILKVNIAGFIVVAIVIMASSGTLSLLLGTNYTESPAFNTLRPLFISLALILGSFIDSFIVLINLEAISGTKSAKAIKNTFVNIRTNILKLLTVVILFSLLSETVFLFDNLFLGLGSIINMIILTPFFYVTYSSFYKPKPVKKPKSFKRVIRKSISNKKLKKRKNPKP